MKKYKKTNTKIQNTQTQHILPSLSYNPLTVRKSHCPETSRIILKTSKMCYFVWCVDYRLLTNWQILEMLCINKLNIGIVEPPLLSWIKLIPSKVNTWVGNKFPVWYTIASLTEVEVWPFWSKRLTYEPRSMSRQTSSAAAAWCRASLENTPSTFPPSTPWWKETVWPVLFKSTVAWGGWEIWKSLFLGMHHDKLASLKDALLRQLKTASLLDHFVIAARNHGKS